MTKLSVFPKSACPSVGTSSEALPESFSDQLLNVMQSSFVYYRHVRIELPEFKVNGKKHTSLKAACDCIDDKFSSLAKSIAA
jgi:hypothetical protein